MIRRKVIQVLAANHITVKGMMLAIKRKQYNARVLKDADYLIRMLAINEVLTRTVVN